MDDHDADQKQDKNGHQTAASPRGWTKVWPWLVLLAGAIPYLLFPLWWYVPASADPQGLMREWHATHLKFLTILQALGWGFWGLMFLGAIPLMIFWWERRRQRLSAYMFIFPLLGALYFQTPAFIRWVEYPQIAKHSEVLATDMQAIDAALQVWQLKYNELPADMAHLASENPNLPVRPPVAKLANYDFVSDKHRPEVYVIYSNGYLWWDSGASLVYCPDEQCFSFGYGHEAKPRFFGDLLYSDQWRLPKLKLQAAD